MSASSQTLGHYIEGHPDGARVLVEHHCGANLGEHVVALTFGFPGDVGSVEIVKSWHPRPSKGRPQYPGDRGPLTGPRVELDGYGAKTYARVRCRCLPGGHDEKVGLGKLGSLPVTFPQWKWGRAIDVPVVTI